MRTNVTNSAKCKLARFFSFFGFFPHQSIGLRFPVIESEYFTALLSKDRIVSVLDTYCCFILKGLMHINFQLVICQSSFESSFHHFCRLTKKKRVDISENLTLDNIRSSLILQEDSIIFSLLERSQYCYNASTYDPEAFALEGFHGSLIEFILKETEKLHAQVCCTYFF